MLTTVSLLVAAVSLIPAAGKITGQPRMRASAAHFAIPWPRYRLIGVAEAAAAAGVLAGLAWRPIGIAAGSCFAVLLLGAIASHLRARDSGREMLPALVILAVDALYLALPLTA